MVVVSRRGMCVRWSAIVAQDRRDRIRRVVDGSLAVYESSGMVAPQFELVPESGASSESASSDGFRLRDYQVDMVRRVESEWAWGRRSVVLTAPTGAGKTAMACAVMRSAVGAGERAWFVVHLITLVEQTVDKFAEYGFGVGVVQGVNTDGEDASALVCSAQTLSARDFAELGEESDPHAVCEAGPRCDGRVCDTLYMEEVDLSSANLPDLLVVDECHLAYRYVRRLVRAVARNGGRVLGLTATPYMPAHWLSLSYEVLVPGVPTASLMHGGRGLVPYIPKVARASSGGGLYKESALKRKRGGDGEFTEASVSQAFNASVVGSLVDDWVAATEAEYGGPCRTLVAAPTVDIGEQIAEMFNSRLSQVDDVRYRGVRFGVTSYQDGKNGRPSTSEMLGRYDGGELDGLISVHKLGIGFDRPNAQALVMARPFASLTSLAQWVGRVLRAAPGKPSALVLDHAGNFARNGRSFLEHVEKGPLSFPKVRERGAKGEVEVEMAICLDCGRPFRVSRLNPHSLCTTCRGDQPVLDQIDGIMEDLDLRFGREDLSYIQRPKSADRLWYELSCAAKRKFQEDSATARREALRWAARSYALIKMPVSHVACEPDACRAGDGVRTCYLLPPGGVQRRLRDGSVERRYALHRLSVVDRVADEGTRDVAHLLADRRRLREELLSQAPLERPDVDTVRCGSCGRFAALSEMAAGRGWHSNCRQCRRGLDALDAKGESE